VTLPKNYPLSLVESLFREYYLEPEWAISSIVRAKGHAITSQNYVISTLSGKEEKEQFLLKIRPRYDDAVLKRLRIVDECFREGIKVAQIIKSQGGALYVTKENFLLVVFKFYSGETGNFTAEEIFSAGENLARLNKRLGQVKDVFKRSDLYCDLSAKELGKIEQMIDVKDSFTEKVAPLGEKLPHLYRAVNGKLASQENTPQLVHLDYHPDNVLFRDQVVEAILDYDFIVTAPKLQSLAFACDRFSKDLGGMMKFIEGYQKVDETLSPKSLELVPSYVRREALSRINYILRSYFLHRDDEWNFELDKHLMVLDKMDRIESKFVSRIGEVF